MAFTKDDKKYLEKLFDKQSTVFDIKFALQKDEILEEVEVKFVKHKSDTMNHIDSFAGEIKTNQEERTVQAHHIIRNTKRIEKLETQFK